MSEKTPEAYEIDEMLDLDAKVIWILYFGWLISLYFKWKHQKG